MVIKRDILIVLNWPVGRDEPDVTICEEKGILCFKWKRTRLMEWDACRPYRFTNAIVGRLERLRQPSALANNIARAVRTAQGDKARLSVVLRIYAKVLRALRLPPPPYALDMEDSALQWLQRSKDDGDAFFAALAEIFGPKCAAIQGAQYLKRLGGSDPEGILGTAIWKEMKRYGLLERDILGGEPHAQSGAERKAV